MTAAPTLIDWHPVDGPRNLHFDDIYRPRGSGALAQSRGVFLEGCGLPVRWRGRERFTVLETGFGLGLNFLTTWAAWEADPQRSWQLHFLSVEAHPVDAADLLRSAEWLTQDAAAAPSDLLGRVKALTPSLADAWGGLVPGVNEWQFADGRVRLSLAVGDVQAVLAQWPPLAVDAVYLDGFSPGRNPVMWSPETLRAVARHGGPDLRLATYTTARPVRDALAEVGFQVIRQRGVPPKYRRLEACWAPRTAAPR